jgi:hypothetical protein
LFLSVCIRVHSWLIHFWQAWRAAKRGDAGRYPGPTCV